ncbi:MAG: glutaredoxin 3 [Nevskiaceae bacterium]|nr:MAG: glutaredoxin 3 [Nevskiaceae bacterium]TBR73080.1 MAG: glutaredoxin 3 [Nevskiaceae bacterium]
MKPVLMYATLTCPYCMAARQLLQHKHVPFEEVRVDSAPEQRQVMMQRSGRHTVPQIFIDGQSIGGYDELSALERNGKLDPMLADA